MKNIFPYKIEILPSEPQEINSNPKKTDKNSFRKSRNITNNFSLYQNNVINNYLLTETKTYDNFSSKVFSTSTTDKLKTINKNIMNKNFTKQKSIIKLVKKNTINIQNNNNKFPLITPQKTFKKQNTVTFLDTFKFKKKKISSHSLEKVKLMNEPIRNNYIKKSSLRINSNHNSFKSEINIKEKLSKSLFNSNRKKKNSNTSISNISSKRISIESFNSDNSNSKNNFIDVEKLSKNLEDKNICIKKEIKKKKTYHEDLFQNIFKNEKVISKKFINDMHYKFEKIESKALDTKIIFIDNIIEGINNNRLIFNDREKLYKDMEKRLFFKFSIDKVKDEIFIKKQNNYFFYIMKKVKEKNDNKFSTLLYSLNNYIGESYLNINIYKNIYEEKNININIHKRYKIFKKSSKSFLSNYSNKSIHLQKSIKKIHHSKNNFLSLMIINKRYNFNIIKNFYSIEYNSFLNKLEKNKSNDDNAKSKQLLKQNTFNMKTFVKKRTNKFLKMPSQRSNHEHNTLRSLRSFRSMKSFYENDDLNTNVKYLIFKSLKNNEFYKRNKIYHIVHHKGKSTPVLFNFHLNKNDNEDSIEENINDNNHVNHKYKFHMTQNNMVYKVNEYKNYIISSLKAAEKAIFYIKDRNFPFFKKIFEEKNLNPDIRDDNGNPLLILAVQSNSFQTVNYLLNKGANPNIQNLNLNTPLHYALTFHNFEIADMLIQTGANEKIKNKMGNTPWECLNSGASIV